MNNTEFKKIVGETLNHMVLLMKINIIHLKILI